MHDGKSYCALIPARGGSKGLPGKNIKILGDKPLIAWSIMAAKESSYIDRVMVSTDDQAIADVSKKYGADIPFMRPEHLANDTAKMLDVIEHTYHWLCENDRRYDYLVLMQPTSPFRSSKHVNEAIELRHRHEAEVVLGVVEADHSPLLYNKLPPDGNMNNFYGKQLQNLNRQEMDKYYRLNGAMYVVSFEYLLRERRWIGEKTYAYVMDRRHSVDIDHIEDFLLAQALLSNNLV